MRELTRLHRCVGLVALVSLLTVGGCSAFAGYAQAYDGPERKRDEVAKVDCRSAVSLRILAVDGQPVNREKPDEGEPNGVVVLPGRHEFRVKCASYKEEWKFNAWLIPGGASRDVEVHHANASYRVEVEAGHAYSLELVPDGVDDWDGKLAEIAKVGKRLGTFVASGDGELLCPRNLERITAAGQGCSLATKDLSRRQAERGVGLGG